MADIKILTNLDLNGNEIQNVIIQNLATAPNNPKVGQTYFDTNDNIDKVWNGTEWIARNVGGADTNTTYTFAEGETNGAFEVTPSNSTKQTINIHGLNNAAYKDVDSSITSDSTSTNIPTSAAVATAISNAMSAINGMTYKGTIGTGGDYADLPDSHVSVGDTYIVVSSGTYAGQTTKNGDMFIATAITPVWSYIPSGDDVCEVNKSIGLNPTLTSSGGECVWVYTHGLNNQYPITQIYEVSSGELVIADVVATSTSACTVKINSSTNISESTYKIVCIG